MSGESGPVEVLVVAGEKRRAVRWATAEARRRGTVLEVVIAGAGPDGDTGPESAFARVLHAIREAVPGLPVSARRADGPAVRTTRGGPVDAGLLVVPADLPELAAVVAESYCPVAVVPEQATTPGGPVVVGIAPWTTGATVDLAFAAAAVRRAKLVAARAWDDPAIDLGLPRPDRIDRWDDVEQRARRELELALSAGRVAHPEVPTELVVAQDRAAELLLALSTRAQLLVLGRSEHGALLAGSPVDALLRAARCPVVVVPADGPPHPTLLPGRSRGWAITHR